MANVFFPELSVRKITEKIDHYKIQTLQFNESVWSGVSGCNTSLEISFMEEIVLVALGWGLLDPLAFFSLM